MSENLLENGGFEADWSEGRSHRCLVFPRGGGPQEREVGNIFTPPGWVTWFRHDPGAWDQPEVRDAMEQHDPRRVHSGEKAILLFTFYRKHDAGFLQQVQVKPGTRLQLKARAHAWSNHPLKGYEWCDLNGRCSCGVGEEAAFILEGSAPPSNGDPWHDAIPNFTFYLGIDPTGGTNPLADTVVWGQGAHVYNAHREVPAVEAEAQADTVTVFLRSKTLWAFRNNDAYWDDAELVVVGERVPPVVPPPPPGPPPLPPPPERGQPRAQYERTYVLVPPGAGELFMCKLLDLIWDIGKRWTVGGSADDAGVGDLDVRRVVALRPAEWPGSDGAASLEAFFNTFYPGVVYWPLDWDNDYQLRGRLLAYSLKEAGLELAYPTTHQPPRTTDVFGRWRPRSGPYHCGLDLASSWSVWRDEILSATDGVVVEAGRCGDQSGFGCRVRVRMVAPDGQEFLIRYAHLRDDGVYVGVGDHVVAGQKLGRAGSTGTSTGDHLHIDVKVGDTYADPALMMRWPDTGMATPALKSMAGVHPEGVHPGDMHLGDVHPGEESRIRTSVLLPPVGDTVERLEWRVAATIGSSERMWAVGHPDGAGARGRDIVAVNPGEWDEGVWAWYSRHYPDARRKAIETESPWEMAIKLLPPLGEDIALAQTDPRWADYDFGEDPDEGGETIGRYGCFLTGLAMALRKIYQRDVTPPLLDKLLVAARAAYVDDNIMMWQEAVPLFPAFDGSIKDNELYSARELEELLEDGWEIILRRADGGHFVYLEGVEGETLHVIDTWDGRRKEEVAFGYRGIRAARARGRRPPPGLAEPLGTDGEAPGRALLEERSRCTHVLLPWIEDAVERLEWRIAATIGSSEWMWAIGHPDGNSGSRRRGQGFVPVNPRMWGGDLRAWYSRHCPNVWRRAIETESPWEMAIKLLPPLGEDIALAQTDPRWADYDFGEDPDEGGETIGRCGCLLTGLAMVLRKVYQRDVTPPLLDKLLVAARTAYAGGDVIAWGSVIPLFPAFDDGIKDDRSRSVRELERLLKDGWEIVLSQVDGGRFVYLEGVVGDALHVIDTQEGERKEGAASEYAGIRAAHVRPRGAPRPAPRPRPGVLVGLHDERGGEWMAARGIKGCCLVHHVVQHRPAQVDCSALRDAGITVIARLGWGYAGGPGTLPRPDDRDAFIDAVVQTMLAARGVAYFHVGNEPNNRSEWPGFETGGEFPLTAEYVAEIYNAIWQRVAGRARMGPPPLDPYFGPNSSNRDWWMGILDSIAGADALFLHAKTQTNNPADVRSMERFADEPLTWQYLHLRTVETALAVVPDRFRSLPVFVTELNPQRLRKGEDATGWLSDNGKWVHEALAYFREEQPVAGVVFYRYELAGDQAPFGLEDKPTVLEAIEREGSGQPSTWSTAAGREK